MSNFWIMKTGRAMFDLERAYGLGLVLYRLSGLEGTAKDTWVYEAGSSYQIKTKASRDEVLDVPNWKEEILSLIPEDAPFVRSRDRSPLRNNLNKLTKKENFHEILWGRYHDLDFSERLKTATLYGTLEPSAFKGFRTPVLWQRQYSEGVNIRDYDILDISLAAIGFANFAFRGGVGLGRRRSQAMFLPVPDSEKGVRVDRYNSIKKEIGRNWFNSRVGVRVMLARAFINLFKILWTKRRDDVKPWEDVFTSVNYSLFERAGQQYKPGESGVVSLHFLNHLLNYVQGKEILETFDSLLRFGEVRGHEDLSLKLSEFIFSSNVKNWYEYSMIHIREMLEPQARVRLYKNDYLKEVLNYVE